MLLHLLRFVTSPLYLNWMHSDRVSTHYHTQILSMTERRHSQPQWTGVAQPYLNTYTSSFASNGYNAANGLHSPISPTARGGYPPDASYSNGYYSSTTPHSSHSPSSPVYHSPVSPSGSESFNRHPTEPATRALHYTYAHSQSYSTYSPSPTTSHPPDDAYTRPRSHSQAYPINETISLSPPPPPQQVSQYQQIPLSPAMADSQFSGAVTRPFACDLCALSFNRQHDLKRHRETHTGEKPFLCNGGCGKTFTRKDALKRHQVWKPFATSLVFTPNLVLSSSSKVAARLKKADNQHFALLGGVT